MAYRRSCILFLLPLCLPALLGGCAPKGDGLYDQSALANLRTILKYPHVVVLDTTRARQIVTSEDHVTNFNRAIEDHLVGAKVFKTVARNRVASAGAPVLEVRTHIIGMHVVSVGNRLWGGAYAGKSNMRLRVTLTEHPSKKVVARRIFDSSKELASSTNPFVANYSFGATDQRMADDMGIIVGGYVLQNAGTHPEERERARQDALDALPKTADRCKAATACKRYGKCSLVDGQCAVTSSSDCEQALVCKEWSYCLAKEGACVAQSEEGCRGSSLCQRKGHCTYLGDACIATTQEDCKKSTLCQELKKCVLNGSTCDTGPVE